jgi:hypothetical protein
MEYKIHTINGKDITEITSCDFVIQSSQEMLELIHCMPSNIIVLKKKALHESFFDLKTGLAGDILQKFSNYNIKLGVIGDYSCYNSKSLKDFIFESNKKNNCVFVDSIETALKKLSS